MTTADDFGAIEPWVWTATSACAFACFIIVPDRLKEVDLPYSSLTGMTVDYHYTIWSIQVSEWIYQIVEFMFSFYYEFPPVPITSIVTYVLCVGTLMYFIWNRHAKGELVLRRRHQEHNSDEYRRPISLIPNWGLMTLWMLTFSLLFHWVGGIHILMYQVYSCAIGLGILLMIFVP